MCVQPLRYARSVMSTSKRPWWWVVLTLVLVFTFGAIAHAQIATATLTGSIRDETGGALSGVTLTVKSPATGATRTAITDAQGRYQVTALEPGEYDIRAELKNYKAVVRTGVVLTVGGTTETDLAMALGAVTEEVTVRAETPLIEPSRMDLSRVVTSTEIESLPISGRNFVDFVKL